MEAQRTLSRLASIAQLKDYTYLAIKRAIVDGVFGPGDALVEAELASQLGVSKTPVREAILRLEVEGLVERVRHTGSYVRALSLEDVQEIYVIMRELEALAVRVVTPGLTPADIAEAKALLEAERKLWSRGDITCEDLEGFTSFHEWVRLKLGNKHLINMLHQLDGQALRLRMTLARREGWIETSARDHALILEAMEAGDTEKAASYVRAHDDHIVSEVTRLAHAGVVKLSGKPT